MDSLSIIHEEIVTIERDYYQVKSILQKELSEWSDLYSYKDVAVGNEAKKVAEGLASNDSTGDACLFRYQDTVQIRDWIKTFREFQAQRLRPARSYLPGGHPKSPTCGHLKIPHPAVAFKT